MIYYVVGVLRYWTTLELKPSGPFPYPLAVNVDENDPCVGFLPVFTTREAAEEFADGQAGIFTIYDAESVAAARAAPGAPADPGDAPAASAVE